MKTNVTATLLIMLAVRICCVANAEVTDLVNYQSKLKKNGTNEHGQVNVTFRVYTGETNEVCVYQESQQVQVKEGLLSTLIGKTPSQGDIGEACKLDNAYLDVEINGNKLKPREKFTPPPFASNTTQIWSAFGNGRDGGGVGASENIFANLAVLGCTVGWQEFFEGSAAEWITFPSPSKTVTVKAVRVSYLGAGGGLGLSPNEAGPQPNPAIVFQTFVYRTNSVSEPIGENQILILQYPSGNVAYSSNSFGWNSLPLSTNTELTTVRPGEYLRVRLFPDNLTTNDARNLSINAPRIMFQAEVR